MSENAKYVLYRCLFTPLAWLPLWMLYGLSNLLYFVFYHCLHYRIKVVRENLSSSFPQMSQEELKNTEREFYHQLCDTIVESIKLLCISNRTIDRRVHVNDAHLVEEAADRNRPVFLYLGHICNWEWVPAITHHFNRPKTTAQIYKPLHDKAFDRFMQRMRSRFNALNIPQNQALRTLMRLRKEEGSFIVGILDDHSPNHNHSRHYMNFLSHPGTIINVGAEEIGRRMDAEFLYLDVVKTGRGHYLLTFKRIEPTPEEQALDYPMSYAYMRMLEKTIRHQPPYWLWSHKRWRYTAPEVTEAESN